MNSGILTLDKCYEYFLIGILIFLSIMLILILIKACMGPSVADRIVCINMMGTMVMVMIAVLAILLKEGYLVDICIIYAMISFLSVIVVTKVYMGVYREKKETEKKENGSLERENHKE